MKGQNNNQIIQGKQLKIGRTLNICSNSYPTYRDALVVYNYRNNKEKFKLNKMKMYLLVFYWKIPKTKNFLVWSVA